MLGLEQGLASGRPQAVYSSFVSATTPAIGLIVDVRLTGKNNAETPRIREIPI